MARFHAPIKDSPDLKKMGVTNATHCYGSCHDWRGPSGGYTCFSCGAVVSSPEEMSSAPSCTVTIIPRSWLPVK